MNDKTAVQLFASYDRILRDATELCRAFKRAADIYSAEHGEDDETEFTDELNACFDVLDTILAQRGGAYGFPEAQEETV